MIKSSDVHFQLSDLQKEVLTQVNQGKDLVTAIAAAAGVDSGADSTDSDDRDSSRYDFNPEYGNFEFELLDSGRRGFQMPHVYWWCHSVSDPGKSNRQCQCQILDISNVK